MYEKVVAMPRKIDSVYTSTYLSVDDGDLGSGVQRVLVLDDRVGLRRLWKRQRREFIRNNGMGHVTQACYRLLFYIKG